MDKHISAKEVVGLLKSHNFEALHIHHTWSPSHKHFTGSNHQSLQDGMRNYHTNTLGWSDIGQHLSIMPDGVCITGRSFSRNPASISGHNSGAFAVEMVGNFDKGNDVFKGSQKDAMIIIAKYFMDNEIEIIFHNEYSSKTCPGTSINKAEFLGEVKAYGVSIPDDQVSPWAEEAWQWGIDKAIIEGTNPKATATKEEVMLMIYRYLNR